MSRKSKQEAAERYAKANADVVTESDKDLIRRLVEFTLYCQHGSPRSGDLNNVVPVAQTLKARFNLKMVHYDREHPED